MSDPAPAPAASETPLLAARGLGYAWPDGTPALQGVDLRLAPGERVGLVGPNGAGKSTLLLCLAGVLTPEQGELSLAGQPVARAQLPELHRRVGLVFQHPDDMLFTTRVRDDVAFGPRQARLPAAEVEARVEEALAATGAARLAERVPQHLSAGEKRAVALAAVLALRPEVLLLDEPTSDLDPRGRRGLLALLGDLSRALLVASHDLEFVLALCTRVVVLDQGAVVADGPARAVLGDEALMLRHGLERPHSLQPHLVHRSDHDHDHDHA